MDTDELKAAVQRQGRRFDGQLRSRLIAAVVELTSAGISRVEVAERLGLSEQTVSRYVVRSRRGDASRPVSVAKSSSGRRLLTPSGFVIEGLSVSEIELLIRKLS